MNYKAIILCFVLGFFLPLVFSFAYPDNIFFFLVNSSVSLLLITLFLHFGKGRLVEILVNLECSAIFLNMWAAVGYISNIDFFYNNYEYMLNSINIIEVIALIFMAPYNGIRGKLYGLRDNFFNFLSRDFSPFQYFKKIL